MARIQRKAHDSSVVLYNHQKEAMCALNKADIGGEFSGIIVLPTGGGKTITASYWLTKNAINAHAKIIWVSAQPVMRPTAVLRQASVTVAARTIRPVFPR